MSKVEFCDIDRHIIYFFRRMSVPTARIGLFVVFFWFGLLKLLGLSPAAGIVEGLYNAINIIPLLDFHSFYFAFAALECVIGILFLIKGTERFVLPLLTFHMITTFLPLFFLPSISWQAPWVPTLEGQYIIKNLVIIAAAIGIASHLHPMKKSA